MDGELILSVTVHRHKGRIYTNGIMAVSLRGVCLNKSLRWGHMLVSWMCLQVYPNHSLNTITKKPYAAHYKLLETFMQP